MSQQNARRLRREAVVFLPPDLDAYKRRCLGALGWTSKADEHGALKAGIADTVQAVTDATLRPTADGAKAMEAMSKGAGSNFKAYQKQLGAFERESPRTIKSEVELRAAAQAYLDHAAGYKEKERAQPNNVAKVESCNRTIAELDKLARLRGAQADLGEPPWNSATAMQAAALRAELDFETLPADGKTAPRLEGSGKNQAFWLNKRAGGGTTKTFIFKPSNPMDAPGFPNGGEPAREAMAGRVADMLNDVLQLGIPMPETHVVSLPTSSFASDDLDNVQRRGASISGSLQTFASTDGELRERPRADLARVSPRDCQAAAVLDMITLNTDRHGGNFLVRNKANNEPELVPIDHGMTFPTQASSDHIVKHVGSTHNALLALPGSHEPFSDEMKAKLATLDPGQMQVALKRERDVLTAVQPAAGATLSDESIAMAVRSAMFLKRAATSLTPAAAQVSLSRFHRSLFDPALTDTAFAALADQIIQDAAADQADIAEYFLMGKQQQERMKQTLEAAGWDVGQRDFTENSILLNPALALKLYKSGAVLPPAPQPAAADPNERPMDLGNPAELNAAIAVFPSFDVGGADPDPNKARAMLKLWREYLQLNGSPQAVDAAAVKVGRRKGLATLAKSLPECVAVLREAERLDAAVAGAPVVDYVKRSLDLKYDLVLEISTGFAPPQQASMQQTVAAFRTSLLNCDLATPAGMADLKRLDAGAEAMIKRTTDALQARLNGKIEGMRGTPPAIPDADYVINGNLSALSDAVNAGAFDEFRALMAKINDPGWNAVLAAP